MTNNSEESMQLNPEEFLTSFKGVIASGISCSSVNPSEVTLVFVIVEADSHA